MSYGLGALVLGRVCEVAYERIHRTKKRFSDIMAEMLFKPLDMTSVTNPARTQNWRMPYFFYPPAQTL